jgi:hypothetical protein
MAYDRTLPALNTKVKSADDAYRANWSAIQDAIGREHEAITDATSGGLELPSRCKVVKVSTLATISGLANVAGALAFATDYWDFYINDGVAWNRATQINPSGVAGSACAFFYNSTAPVGWTLLTSLEGQVLMINSTIGGSISGSWTITGIAAGAGSGDHIHEYSQVISHTHTATSYDTQAGQPNNWVAGLVYYTGYTDYTGTTPCSSNATYGYEASGDGAWRPPGHYGLLCVKDA